MQTVKPQASGQRKMPETRLKRVSGIIRSPSGWDFSVCIEDRW